MSRISVGIILHNPDLLILKENLRILLKHAELVILVDNNSVNNKEIECSYKEDRVILIKNKQNLGVSKALNQIMEISQENGIDWVLTLDQDSIIPDNIFQEYTKYLNLDQIAIISPVIVDRNYSSHFTTFNGPDVEFIDKAITSGSLINVNTCIKAGLFDEQLFIDLVDFEYCLRLKNMGYKVIKVNRVILLHQLGNLRIYNIFNKKVFVTNHSKERVYYFSRNWVYYQRKHSSFVSKKERNFELIKKLFKIIVLEKGKMNKFRYFYNGIRDAKLGKMGKL